MVVLQQHGVCCGLGSFVGQQRRFGVERLGVGGSRQLLVLRF